MLNNDIRNVIGELADLRDEETIFLDLKQKFQNIISKRWSDCRTEKNISEKNAYLIDLINSWK